MSRARRRFREGIATYLGGRLLHGYLGFRVLETELAGGRQARVVRGLYDELAHTTATHGGFETGVRVFGSRAVDDDMTPHGWFAAEYATLLRNMLVREERGGLVLMSALSPRWLRPGRVVSVRGAPTLYGPVDFALRARRRGASLRWRARVPPGTTLRWPLPYAARHVRAPGLRGRSIALRVPSGSLRVRWRLRRSSESYADAVRRLTAAYRHHGR
jgi:hypothetical protein